MDQTECEVGFDLLYDFLWDILHPADHATHTELICRIKKARWVVMALERGLSAIGVLEKIYPIDREAVSRFKKPPESCRHALMWAIESHGFATLSGLVKRQFRADRCTANRSRPLPK
jgi:hypothetical protein